MEGKFDGMYMNHPANKNDEREEENQRKRESQKIGRSQRTRDGENSTRNSGSGKILTLSSKMQSEFCTDCGMSQDDTTQIIGLYNQSNYGASTRHIPENGLI